MYSTQCYSCHTRKPRPTDLTSSDHRQTSTTTKNDGKSKPYSTTENEAEDINTTSSGKAMTSQKRRGNQPCVSKAVVKKFFKSTATNTASTPSIATTNVELYTITLIDPEGKETTIWPAPPWKHHPFKLGLYPELSPPTEEELVWINARLGPPPKKSIIKKISREFRSIALDIASRW